MDNRIRVGFVIPGDSKWNGGVNYLRSVLAVISENLSHLMTAQLFISPDQAALAAENFSDLLECPVIIDSRVAGAGNGKRALEALLLGKDRAFADLITLHRVDVMFETARFYGRRFPVPILTWIPDFQHKHMQHLFSRSAWWKRELGFRAQCYSGRVILLSSLTAQADCENAYPTTRGRTKVARFAARVPFAEVLARQRSLRADYDLPERFFYLPNQFWEHKNHNLVVTALATIASTGGLADLPPVIMTGATSDPRNPKLFDKVMRQAQKTGVAEHFRHLGTVAYLDVLALNMMAVTVLNPSKFEGWASSLEEAKAMFSPLAISDISIHREQAPFAQFFGSDDASALARILTETASIPRRQLPDAVRLAAADSLRCGTFADEFMAAVLATGVRSR